ncbi:methyltransferase [Psychroserpens algicola]|uniref:methyltransferase n=1 Tax=Psychroserpens algicola TaxID=1719034 RepID=UPI001953E1C9|nr:methyltransferase [Psychroserpens algicola]
MKYESKTQINRIEWHYFINEQFHSIQNLDMRMYFPQELDTYLKWSGFTIQINRFLFVKKHSENDYKQYKHSA